MLRLPALFSDHAIFQRRRPIPVWGWADPGMHVTVTFNGDVRVAKADAGGAWRTELEPQDAGGPFILTVRHANGEERVIQDVLIGEVWLCSGQSNMEWPCSISGFPAADLAKEVPNLRLFKVPLKTARKPQTDVGAAWTTATPDHLAQISGVGFAVARELLTHLNVPVGLIHTAWGGTYVEAWTSLAALEREPEAEGLVAGQRKRLTDPEVDPDSPKGKALLAEWEASAYHQDPGIAAAAATWMDPALPDGDWPTMRLPCTWESTGMDIDGAVWFRREVELSAADAAQVTDISLGCIDDFDQTWINGTRIGSTGPEVANAYGVARRYGVPAGVLRAGRNVVAIRVFDRFGAGGMYTGPFRFDDAAGKAVSEFGGDWRYRVELELPPKRSIPPSPFGEPQHEPGALFNAMIAPLIPYAVRGVLWYQGESNAGRAEQYRALLPAMITDWRAQWDQPLPVLVVQLNAWQTRSTQPGPSPWAELREAQTRTTHAVEGVWRCVGIDTGDEQDIHPRNKALIGYRLALLARRHVYEDRALMADSPEYASHTIEGEAMRIRLRHARGLYAIGGNPVRGFQIAGADRVWHWAEAVIDNEDVVVRCAAVPAPAAVRYGWSDYPTVNLYNAAGLPCDAFRTDDWPMATTGAR